LIRPYRAVLFVNLRAFGDLVGYEIVLYLKAADDLVQFNRHAGETRWLGRFEAVPTYQLEYLRSKGPRIMTLARSLHFPLAMTSRMTISSSSFLDFLYFTAK
jgi:hypothetical protein